MATDRLEYFWFLPYSIKVKEFLQKKLYLSSYPADKNVQIVYSTPSRAFAKFIIPVINGGNLNPTIIFTLSSYQPSQGQTPGGYYRTFKNPRDEVWLAIKHPLPYELTYHMTVWATRQSDADILMYQAMTAAPFNRKYSTKVDGQWAEFEIKNIANESNLDPGEAQDVSVRYGFDILIPRAYLPLDYEEYSGSVKEFDIGTEFVTEI